MLTAPLERKGRAIVLGFVGILCVACATGGVRRDPKNLDDYWRALAELRPEDAMFAARSQSQREFAVGLVNLMRGRLGEAETFFASLRSTADDSVLRIGADGVHCDAPISGDGIHCLRSPWMRAPPD
jgi:hypothetical protein